MGTDVNSRSTGEVAGCAPGRDLSGRHAVAGLFDDRTAAERAIRALRDRGFDARDIGIAMRERNEHGYLVEDSGARVADGAISGAVGGGLLGGLVGLLVGLGSLAIPGIGPVIAGGALATAFGAAGGTALAGAGLGAAAGGLVGALVGMGMPEAEARYFEPGFQAGNILVTVNAAGRVSEAWQILEEHGADTGRHAGGTVKPEMAPQPEPATARRVVDAPLSDAQAGVPGAPSAGLGYSPIDEARDAGTRYTTGRGDDADHGGKEVGGGLAAGVDNADEDWVTRPAGEVRVRRTYDGQFYPEGSPADVPRQDTL